MTTVTVFTTQSNPTMPCNLTVDVSCCEDWDTFDPDLQQAAAEYGALMIWASTGRRFSVCQRTVRPCSRECSSCMGGAGYYWSEGTWMPYVLNGAWRNCWCGGMSGCPHRCLGSWRFGSLGPGSWTRPPTVWITGNGWCGRALRSRLLVARLAGPSATT